MLSATRRRVLPATMLASGALAAGILGTTIPAQAAVVTPTSTVATSTVATTSVATTTVATTSPTVPSTTSPAWSRQARPGRSPPAGAMKIRVSAVSIAKSRVGSKYRAGRVGPRAFDCSGLALYVVKKATGRSLPHYSKAQFRATKRVAKKQPAPRRPGVLLQARRAPRRRLHRPRPHGQRHQPPRRREDRLGLLRLVRQALQRRRPPGLTVRAPPPSTKPGPLGGPGFVACAGITSTSRPLGIPQGGTVLGTAGGHP